MKKIQREVKTYTDIYVSVDGKEFTNEADCKAWEKSYKGTLEASWKLIKKIEVNTCDLGLPWSNDDYECYVLRPKNLDEICLINAYIESSTSYNGILTSEFIGRTIALNFGYDHDYCDVYVLEEHLSGIAQYIDKVDNEIRELA